MKKIIGFLTLISLQFAVYAQEKYSRVKVNLTEQTTIQTLYELGFETDHGYYIKNQSFESDLSLRDLDILKAANISYEILIDDVSAYYRKRTQNAEMTIPQLKKRGGECKPIHQGYVKPNGFNYGNMGGFFTYQEAINKLDSLALLYPNIVSTKKAIGNFVSHEGDSIFVMKISDNPNQDENEPEMLYSSLHHAREALSLSQLVYYMYYLCENYTTSTYVKYLVDNLEMYFVPIVNPDGYKYNEQTNPFGGGMWRKNRRNNGGGTWGVDLNRNYGLGWGYNNTGSSPNSSSDTYRGPSGFSEPETQAMQYLCNSRTFQLALNYHTYSNLLIYPWGYLSKNCDDSLLFREFGAELSKYNAYKYGTDLETVGYSTNGSSDDWMYGEIVSKPFIFAMTPEVGNANDGFWPAVNRILPLCEESNYMNLKSAEFLLQYATTEDVTPRLTSSTNGFIKYNLRRLGLLTPYNFTVSLQPISSGIASVGNSKVYNNLNLGQAYLDSISYTLNSNLPNNTELKFVLQINNGTYTQNDTLSVFYGNVQNVITDDCSSFSNWTNTGWSLDNTASVSSPSSFAENPSGNYTANQNKSLVNTLNFDLTDASRAELMFRAKWELENSYDYVMLSVSEDNGISYSSVCAPYTQVTANQNLGTQQVYTGVTSDWVYEIVNLDSYAGKSIKIKWNFVSDPGLHMRGFNLDNIVVNKLVKTGLGLDPVNNQFYTVYPNPTQHEWHITTHAAEPFTAQVLSLDGKICDSTTSQNGSAVINSSALQPGVYLLHLVDKNGILLYRQKLITLK
jgi:carboxypeptidase T